MQSYTDLIKALRSASTISSAWEKLMLDAAAAIEELEKERDYYKRQYENRQRLIKCALGEEWT